jgi:hypothetical protein
MNGLLPRHNININNLRLETTCDRNEIITSPNSPSLIEYLRNMRIQLFQMTQIYPASNITRISHVLNKYEHLTTPVPGPGMEKGVGGVGGIGNDIYPYELAEIFALCHLPDILRSIKTPTMINFSGCAAEHMPNIPQSAIILKQITTLSLSALIEEATHQSPKIDLLNFDLSDDNYLEHPPNTNILLGALLVILSRQSVGGASIIKLTDLHTRPAIETMVVLSSVYNEVYILKPTIGAVRPHKYAVCINFKPLCVHIQKVVENFKHILTTDKTLCVNAILPDGAVSMHFSKKIEELNILFGQQQLSFFEHVLARLTAGGIKSDSAITQSNIQKCIHWCEKYHVPISSEYMPKSLM